MARQDRAELTRRALIAAASAEFDKHGYAGTSLSRVSRAAGVSMGALTFHFAAKDELAAVVQAWGRAKTNAALRDLHKERVPPLQAAIDLTHTLAKLLEEEVGVRAAARLARDGASTSEDWNAVWIPTLREILSRAAAEGALGADPKDFEVLVALLVAGVEAAAHAYPLVGETPLGHGLRQQLTLAWQVLAGMYGVARPDGPELLPAGTA
ncbi:TetR family transcriptional regulator [Streptomyces sp. DSM 116496]|uniref:TetR family transcriptional regulator n=1 Tax=Streptomyces stoeckheimensis TaxID=3344656 RepID=UPI0038B2442A